MPNGNAIGVVTQSDHRQQDDLFKFAERVSGAHNLDLQSRINSRALQATIARQVARVIHARPTANLLADAVQYRNRSFCYAATDTLAVI